MYLFNIRHINHQTNPFVNHIRHLNHQTNPFVNHKFIYFQSINCNN
jgi:hypothetical protein